MVWSVGLSYFFGGAFLVNAIPHFVQGISGHKFPSPFAKPPGRGESSALVNVLWGSFNFATAYLLLVRVGHFDLLAWRDIAIAGVGGLLTAIMLARTFGEVYAGR